MAAAALYSLAPEVARASPRYENRRPDVGKPTIINPPTLNLLPLRAPVDAARDSRLADEWASMRAIKGWTKTFDEWKDDKPKKDRKTGKWWFRGTNGTFHSASVARDVWGVMVDVYDLLQDGNVKGAKEVWKKYKKAADSLWFGETNHEPNSEIHYGDSKADKAEAKADQAAQGEVLDNLWHELKSAEAAGIKPVKPSAPATD
ncbi:MAG: hypothetical protein ACTSXZ_11720 [Alphaproteobacteria bacterium]